MRPNVTLIDDPRAPPIKLEDAIRQSGFDNVNDFTWYGSATLRDVYKEKVQVYDKIDPLLIAEKAAALKERDEAWKRIEAEREKIAQRTFYSEYKYDYWESSIVPGPPASFQMSLSTEIGFHDLKSERVSLPPTMRISCELVEKRMFFGDYSLTIRGDNNDIIALTRNKENYRVKITFTNLRNEGDSYYSRRPTADVQKIEIFKR